MATAVELYKLVASLGFVMRRVRRLLPAAPRRDVILESIVVSLQLIEELADQPVEPAFMREGGMPLLVSLANRIVDSNLGLEDMPVQKSETIVLAEVEVESDKDVGVEFQAKALNIVNVVDLTASEDAILVNKVLVAPVGSGGCTFKTLT